MERTEAQQPVTDAKGRSVRSTIVATGAAFGLTFAGLGVAAALPGGPALSAPQAITLAQSTAPEGGATPTEPGGDARPDAHRRGHHVRPDLAVAASTMGMTEDDLRTAIRDGRTIAEVARSKGVDPQQVIDALVDDGKKQLAAAVAAGEMTQQHADGHAALLDDHVARFVNDTRPGPGFGHGAPGERAKAGLAVAASTIGITEQELVSAVRGGQSIAQVAQSKNVEPQKVIDALVADAEKRLAEKVEAGHLTQAEADARRENLEERITDLVNRTGGLRRSRGGPRGDRMPGAAEPVAATV